MNLMDYFNKAVSASVVRNVLQFLGGYLVSAGLITTEESTALAGAAATIIALIWGMISARQKRDLAKENEALSISHIVGTPINRSRSKE